VLFQDQQRIGFHFVRTIKSGFFEYYSAIGIHAFGTYLEIQVIDGQKVELNL
jgi:hypothetical protein